MLLNPSLVVKTRKRKGRGEKKTNEKEENKFLVEVETRKAERRRESAQHVYLVDF